jgi:YVTN family beta-propeller protein
MTTLRRPLFLASMALAAVAAGLALVSSASAGYLGPQSLLAAKDGKTLFVALADARQITFLDVAGRKVARTVPVPAEPAALALSPDGGKLYVACAAPASTVCVIDTASGTVSGSIPAGHTADALALAPDGTLLYVGNRFNNNVAVIDLATKQTIARVPVLREPIAAAVTPDGKSVFVANHLPLDRSDGDDVAASITVIDTATRQPTAIRLPNGSTSVRGLCLSPDGKYVYVCHILAHYQMPTTQLERGWMNTNALSILDAAAKKLINTVLLDDVDLGAANPWGVTTSGDGKTIFVAHAGTNELSAIDATGLMEKLVSASATPAGVPNDLTFLVSLRRRIKLEGTGPRGVAAIGSSVFAAEYFSDALSVVDLESKSPRPVSQIALGPRPQWTEKRRGEALFFDATICFQHWQSCGSCHPDARVDGLNWDLLNDGIGNPKNNRNMLHVYEGGPAMSLGVRENAAAAVRAGITHILYAVRPEEDAKAIDEYLKSLEPVPSPYLVNGKLSPAAERGKKVFFDRDVGCARCHPEPYYTDKRSHDVGSLGKFDKHTDRFNTPRLTETWRTAPYMHDGSYLTIKELIVRGKHGGKGGNLDNLSEQQIDDLVEFVLSL